MDLNPTVRIIISLISAAIVLFFSVPYLIDMIKNKTKPNRVTWFMLALNTGVVFTIQIGEGVNFLATVPIFVDIFICLAILFVSMVLRRGYYKLERFDYFSGFLSLIALMLWLVVKEPILALLLATLVDFFAFLPTMVKTWKMPDSESIEIYYGSFISILLGIVLIEQFNFFSLFFPIYLLTSNATMVCLIKRQSIKKLFVKNN